MSLRLFATLALLIGLFMWLFNEEVTPLLIAHITCAILVLLLSITALFLPTPTVGNIRIFQGGIVLLAVCTMLVGYLQYQGAFDGLAATLMHLVLALALVGLIETTLARQNRFARASKA